MNRNGNSKHKIQMNKCMNENGNWNRSKEDELPL